MKNVVLLGSTGSIGTSTIKVAEDLPDRIRLVGLGAGNNVELLLEQTRKHAPQAISIFDPAKANELRNAVGTRTQVFFGAEGLLKLATLPNADIVLNEARKQGARVLAVDSEHSAIFQCLEGHPTNAVRRLWLTASGGPFRNTPKEEFPSITVERALRHPSWVMGRKITIDSATLFNKGLEMIEARWLFDVEIGRVSVVVHTQSEVQSMVEFVDGSMLAQLSTPDRCLPIQYALTYPERAPSDRVQTDLAKLGSLTFEEPDPDRFPALDLARRAGEVGGTMPAVLNAANEVAVEAFVNRQINFPQISETVRRAMDRHQVVSHPGLDQVLEADTWARREAAGT